MTDHAVNEGEYVYDGNKPPPELRSQVTSVVVSEGGTRLGAYAFCDFELLTSINLGNSVTTIAALKDARHSLPS
jgi:hypothetical protein